MAIEFYKLDDRVRENVLLLIDEEQFIGFEEVFESFRRRTSVFIDPYRDTRIYPQQLPLLHKLIEEAIESDSLKVSLDVITSLQALLIRMIQSEDGLLILGE